MTVLVAIPVFRLSCTVYIDKGRGWSAVDEFLLWSLTEHPSSLAELAQQTRLPHQVVVASVARMMRFRLVEVMLGQHAAFRASEYGVAVVRNGDVLPSFPKRFPRPVHFVVERVSGGVFLRRDGIRTMSPNQLDVERRNGAAVVIVDVEDGPPSLDQAAAFNHLSSVVAQGWDEQLGDVNDLTARVWDDDFMVVSVGDGVTRNLPDGASDALRGTVARAASLDARARQLTVPYAGRKERAEPKPKTISCAFDPDDLIVGGDAHRACLTKLLCTTHGRIIIHSTFLDENRFKELAHAVRQACARGVSIELLWGTSYDRPNQRCAIAATKIAKFVWMDPAMRGRVKVHPNSTHSHAKILLADQPDGSWVAAIGSCNWLSSPFRSTEISAVLRDPWVVAEVASTMQRISGGRGLSNPVSNELAMVAADLRKRPSASGSARITVLVGEHHDGLMREASGAARSRLLVGSNRLGATAVPGALMPSEFAARSGLTPLVLYSVESGPMTAEAADQLAHEVQGNGVVLLRLENPILHGKFVAWNDDDLVVTSFNWASASTSPDKPWDEAGVHIEAPGLVKTALEALKTIYPQLIQIPDI
ncbi:MAG TPA: phospholipase D-like domain-containing protein [Stellaceae bacterium]|jgi:phosphatidylserine/phosphatidylglycerophosphate/cardiolipin synthase-like enzyme|nr:phospholipase D-like domain-containing protein [Stellaceae bacterium]